MSVPFSLAVWRCATCKSTREQAVDRVEPPTCGTLHLNTDHNAFPGGHWVEVVTRHFESHGEMVRESDIDSNPFARSIREREALAEKAIAEGRAPGPDCVLLKDDEGRVHAVSRRTAARMFPEPDPED